MVLEIFCGCGGSSSGFASGARELGLECDIIGIDKDHDACLTFQKNRVGQAIIGDARFPPIRMQPKIFDVLIGCPPCQGFSRMRGRIIWNDIRNRLVTTFLDFILALQPKYIVFENVPRILGSKYQSSLEKILRACGYRYDSKVLNAAEFGVPQRRKRFILIASKCHKPMLPGPTTSNSITVREAISDLPPLDDGAVHSAIPNHRCMKHSKGVTRRIKLIPANGGSRSSLPTELVLPCHLISKGHHDVYGRMSWDDVAPTLTSGCTNPSKGRFIHPEQNRAISLREAARLQTFSDKFIFHGSFSSVSKQIGNAMPVKLGKCITSSFLRNVSVQKVA